MATPLAEAYVRVRALTDRFKPDVEKGFAGLGDQFGKQFSQEAAARLRDERGRFASAGSDVGEAAGSAAGEAFGRGMAEQGAVQLGDDGNTFVKVGRDIGGDAGKAGGHELGNEMGGQGSVAFAGSSGRFVEAGRRIGDEAGSAAGQAFARRYTQDALGRWHDERGRFVSTAEATGEESGRGFSRGFGRGMQQGVRDSDGFGNAMRRLGEVGRQALETMLPSLGKLTAGLGSTAAVAGSVAAGIAGLGAAAASSAGFVTVLAAELAPAAGLLAALPGVLLTGAAAMTTWKLATAGLGDVMSAALSGDYEKFATEILDLSEAGKTFAREFWTVAQRLREFQAEVQGTFLSELSGHLDRWLQGVLRLQPAISGLASEMGTLVRGFLDFGTSERTISRLGGVFANTRSLVAAVNDALQPLLKGFLDLGTVGSSWLASLSGGLAENLTKFGEWMTRVAESGQAWAWMDNARMVLIALGGVAKDLGAILTGVFGAARDAGTGALGVLGQLVGKFNEWVNSAQGQEVLVTVFKALDAVGRALTPVIAALGGAIAAIAPEAAKVATALGPVLAQAVTVLGKGIAAMGPGLVGMVEAFGRMVTAIGPLEPLGAAIGDMFGELGNALALVVPEVAKIALALAPALGAALRALGPALAALGPGLVAIAENLAKAFGTEAVQNGLLALGKGISDLLVAAAPLIPIITQVAGILLQLLGGAVTNLSAALGPLVKALGEAMAPALDAISRALNLLIPLMEPVYKAFGDIGAALITQLLPPILNLIPTMIDSLIPAFVRLAEELKPLIPLLADFAVKFVEDILPALLPMLPELAKMSLEFTRMGIVLAQLVADVAPHIERFIGFFQRMYDVLVGHSIIPDLINGMTDWFRKGVQWVGDIVSWFGRLPEMIGAWLGTLVDRVQAKWHEIKNAIAAKIDEIKTKIADVLDQIRQKWSDIWNGLKTFVSDKWNEIKTAVSGKIDDMLGTIRGIPGRITGALGNLGSLLWDSGRSVVQGLIDGLYSKLQDAYNAAADILNRIRDLFPFSPAREGPFSGRGWVTYSGASMMAGLAEGILGQRAAVTGALDSVLKAGASTLGAGLNVPLATMGGASPAPDFAGSFGAAASPPGVVAGQRTIVIENLNLQGVFDPTSPVSYRRTVERLREAIRELEEEEYANA
ncbi:hypothetical protein ACBJ59_10570 [Nonomuraea sp. MTCD27]|uniref:phage tail protein n=1 Tax=Nonomuraea sp. MTCD27 TaxID=1676747 RepID=UPI0035C0C3BE